MKTTGQFFAVDRRVWGMVCSLGRINAAIAYLVLARGTLRDLRTTSWSVHAIEIRTDIPRLYAKRAIQALVDNGFVEKVRGGTKPKYYLRSYEDVLKTRHLGGLAKSGEPEPPQEGEAEPQDDQPSEWIWLPNTIVDGASDETVPVERIRQTQYVPILRLYIELYHAQSLSTDGGVNWRMVRETYDSNVVKEWGEWTVYAFKPRSIEGFESADFIKPFLAVTEEPNDERIIDGTGWKTFFAALDKLEESGLIDIVPHAVFADTDDGTVLQPMPGAGQGEEAEREVSVAAQALGAAILGLHRTGERCPADITLLPVQSHLVNVSLVGLVRLRHRAKTKATAAWFERMEEWRDLAERYRAHGRAVMARAPAGRRARSMGNQRSING